VSEIQERMVEATVEPLVNPPSLGLLLQKAREARGLTINDVVQTLKFSQRQIEALEANDLAQLPGNMFARGVVRSYARFLKLDPEPLLALLATEAPVALPDVRPPDNMGNAMPRGGLRQIPPLVAFAVLLLIASATMIGWHFLGPGMTQSLKPAESVVESAPVTAAEPSSVDVASVVPPAVVPEQAAPPTAATPPSSSAPDTKPLAFHFRGKSWVEVKDASQQIILTGQYVEGNRELVTGRPPYQLVIGNAAQVELVYGEQPVDLKPYTRAEVARLSLD
jgi:cytoskeleton protein RodZ